ncbi:origin recognition complex subunit 6 (ORC6) [Ophiocordyceps camponoti-floridani]|uniref:Origin recognition complex subunit 6 (ORC6) n=1 Tax=Ophiocordyceps camponoti-floridani TaxID=2030778 RepID=A0A8H4VCT9_9HYPO|nr:origin recognition complex subunit 6 (ORC6) [Ophiocordyceps camponoti-floridani]
MPIAGYHVSRLLFQQQQRSAEQEISQSRELATMDKQLENALFSMMPAHGPTLAPSLVELAGSLLAQSRNRASALKAEEEVARPYACANLACERLKTVLDLPPIQPRPPIPPRLYKRLYTHLDNILPSSMRGAAVTSMTSRSAVAKGGTASASSRAGDTTTTTASTLETPSRSLRRKRPGDGDDDDAPQEFLYPWVASVVRFICADSGVGKFAPTVLAGVAFVQRQQDEHVAWARQHATALVAALFFYVVSRLDDLSDDEPVDRKGGIVDQLGRARTHVSTKPPAAKFWKGWEALRSEHLDEALAHVKAENWLDGDWFRGIADVVGSKAVAQTDGHDDEGSGRRADTMLQDILTRLWPSELISIPWRSVG